MELSDWGYNDRLGRVWKEINLAGFAPGRVVAEHKERYLVRTEKGELEAEVTGHLRFSAKSRADFPAVGDWVALTIFDDLAIIHQILPRFSVVSRQAVGQQGEVQVIAANIDYALLVQAVDRDYNLNRLERYLTICHASGVSPIVVLTKTDLVTSSRLDEIKEEIGRRIAHCPVLAVSNLTQTGYDELSVRIEKGKSYCMLGSSGVGKSTLLNNLSGRAVMATGALSDSTHKGRHVTTHRELIVLEQGGILIDNPGMREVGIVDTSDGLAATFDRITGLASQCRYQDCTHTGEAGCAVVAAVEKGEIDSGAYENYLRMEREKAHFDASVAERRKKDKEFGKMLKSYHKERRKGQWGD